MSLRVVLYTEGPRESAGLEFRPSLLPAPGDPIPENILGPAHLLVRRCLHLQRGIPEAAICFESPLRIRGKVPRGSELLGKENLHRLLTWLNPERRPHLAIVLVDGDGDKNRKRQLTSIVEGLPVDVVIGVAMHEFETWLIADEQALGGAWREKQSASPSPEGLARGEAKDRLLKGCRRLQRDEMEVRITLANTLDLNVVASRCASFAEFLNDLRTR